MGAFVSKMGAYIHIFGKADTNKLIVSNKGNYYEDQKVII